MWITALLVAGAAPPPDDLPISPFVPTGIAGGIAGSTAGTLTVLGIHANRRCEPTCDAGLPVPALSAGFLIGGLSGMGGGLVLGRAATGKRGPFAVTLGAVVGVAGLTSLGISATETRNDWVWRGAGLGAVFAVGPLLALAVSGEQKPPRGERQAIHLTPELGSQHQGLRLSGRW